MIITPDLPPTGPRVISRFEGEYEFLRNPYPVGIPYKNEMYASVEYAYQAAKFESAAKRDEIRRMPRWQDAKQAGKGPGVRSDWRDVRKKVMFALTWLKYRGWYLRSRLHGTGFRLLIEGNDWHDDFWGNAGNNLGLILMRTRLQNRFDSWAAERFDASATAMAFNPWQDRYYTGSVQRAWETFRAGFEHGHETDWSKL
jgi:predicted NAD-dependent protein-ADP-ribosyltransferase YbiA (DUF1768 family)